MIFKIRCWHGLDARLVAKLDALTPNRQNDGQWSPVWVFEGTFDDFAGKWQEKFIAIPDTDPESKGEWYIYVTQHGNFGQR